MTISHSCCPGKTNMRPPEFEKGNTHMLPKGVMQEWVCTGCRTVIYTLEVCASTPTPTSSEREGNGFLA